jgi:hypothetical protein
MADLIEPKSNKIMFFMKQGKKDILKKGKNNE